MSTISRISFVYLSAPCGEPSRKLPLTARESNLTNPALARYLSKRLLLSENFAA